MKTGGHGCEQLGTKNGSDCPKWEIMTTFWGVTKKTNLRQTARAVARIVEGQVAQSAAGGGGWTWTRDKGQGQYSNLLYLYGHNNNE